MGSKKAERFNRLEEQCVVVFFPSLRPSRSAASVDVGGSCCFSFRSLRADVPPRSSAYVPTLGTSRDQNLYFCFVFFVLI